MKTIKKVICLSLIASVFLAGCAGRKANPVAIYLPGDENRSCDGLRMEITQLQADMQGMLPKTSKEFTNALWATAGAFYIVPYFFMDLKDAEKTEFDAMRRRHNRLLILAGKKKCDMSVIRAERIPSIEEQEAADESQKEGNVIKNKATK